MSMGAGDGDDSAGADRRGDGVGIVRSVDDQHLVVIPQEPHVVVDVEGLAVEAEGAAGDEVLHAGGHGAATRRRPSSVVCWYSCPGM